MPLLQDSRGQAYQFLMEKQRYQHFDKYHQVHLIFYSQGKILLDTFHDILQEVDHLRQQFWYIFYQSEGKLQYFSQWQLFQQKEGVVAVSL